MLNNLTDEDLLEIGRGYVEILRIELRPAESDADVLDNCREVGRRTADLKFRIFDLDIERGG